MKIKPKLECELEKQKLKNKLYGRCPVCGTIYLYSRT
jgi:uncharacterized OB-fold protein